MVFMVVIVSLQSKLFKLHRKSSVYKSIGIESVAKIKLFRKIKADAIY